MVAGRLRVVPASARCTARRVAARAALLVALHALGTALAGAATDSPRDHAGWWLQQYGPYVGPKELAIRAGAVFERVAAAADQSGNRLPKLVLIGTDGAPWALALPDGSVVVTAGALRIAFTAVGREDGDTRLAFVLGHELAHLAKDDFWHASAFSAVARFALGPERQSTLGLLQSTPDRLKEAELQADAYGLLYSTWAGYAPERLLAQPDSFFEQWAAATGETGDAAHPAPPVRADFLRNQLAEVADDLDYFHFGVRLLELGRYEDALLLLERFKASFASREVFTDVGLAHYQLALRELARCDGQLVMRFVLPVEADPTTLATRSRLRGGDDRLEQACLDGAAFREHIAAARRHLELAAARDAAYVPARVDLVATLLLARRNAEALGVAEDALKIAPEAPALLVGKALAFYLFGLESRFETADGALQQLDRAARLAPRLAAALYDRAALLEERGRTAAAREAWQAYLALDPSSPWSETARQRLGSSLAPVASPAPAGPTSPLPLGVLDDSARARLRGYQQRDFVLGDFRGAFLRGPGSGRPVRALAIGSALELVEAPPATRLTRSEAMARYGRPLRRVETVNGEVLVYSDFALSFEGDALESLLFFAASGR